MPRELKTQLTRKLAVVISGRVIVNYLVKDNVDWGGGGGENNERFLYRALRNM